MLLIFFSFRLDDRDFHLEVFIFHYLARWYLLTKDCSNRDNSNNYCMDVFLQWKFSIIP